MHCIALMHKPNKSDCFCTEMYKNDYNACFATCTHGGIIEERDYVCSLYSVGNMEGVYHLETV